MLMMLGMLNLLLVLTLLMHLFPNVVCQPFQKKVVNVTSCLVQIMGKVEVIPGDLAKPQCGISEENQTRLLPEVQYVIHAAASIQFDNPIHTDLTLSYVASKTIADFAAKVRPQFHTVVLCSHHCM